MPRPSVDRPLTIGAVLKGLREEFPDVSISKIRFLESEGLISPDRSPSGYRHYRPGDVERLRYILRAQREHFWPLKVIREALDALDRGLTPPMQESGRPGPPQPTADPDLAEPAGPTDAASSAMCGYAAERPPNAPRASGAGEGSALGNTSRWNPHIRLPRVCIT